MSQVTVEQLQQAIKYTLTGNLVNGAAVLTDATQYGGLGLGTPDTVKVLIQILDPTGNLFYQNIHWNAGTYGGPDLQPILGTGAGFTTYSFTMPQDINLFYLTGQYTINLQVQVVQNGITIVVQNTQYATICNCCNNVLINVDGNVSYNTAQISVTDNTQYGQYISLTRVFTLYPPATTGAASQTGTNVTTLIWEPPMGTFPSTGIWTWKLVSTITYIDAVTQAQTICQIDKIGTFEVLQSKLCVVLCQLEEWRNAYWQLSKQKDTTQLTINYDLAINEFVLAIQSQTCGRPQSQIDRHIAKIYEITGIDPNCECACNNGTNQPLVPTNSIDGTDGTNGSSFLQGVGVPAGSLGAVGDSYLDSSTGNVYKKTGATTWTFTFNIIGTSGVVQFEVIYNNFPNTTTTGTGFAENLTTVQLPANTMSSNFDLVKIHAVFSCGSGGGNVDLSQLCGVSFGGQTPFPAVIFLNADLQVVTYDICVTRITSTTAKFEVIVKGYQTNDTFNVPCANLAFGSTELEQIGNISSGIDFTTNMNIIALGAAPVSPSKEVINTYLRIEYEHKF